MPRLCVSTTILTAFLAMSATASPLQGQSIMKPHSTGETVQVFSSDETQSLAWTTPHAASKGTAEHNPQAISKAHLFCGTGRCTIRNDVEMVSAVPYPVPYGFKRQPQKRQGTGISIGTRPWAIGNVTVSAILVTGTAPLLSTAPTAVTVTALANSTVPAIVTVTAPASTTLPPVIVTVTAHATSTVPPAVTVTATSPPSSETIEPVIVTVTSRPSSIAAPSPIPVTVSLDPVTIYVTPIIVTVPAPSPSVVTTIITATHPTTASTAKVVTVTVSPVYVTITGASTLSSELPVPLSDAGSFSFGNVNNSWTTWTITQQPLPLSTNATFTIVDTAVTAAA